MRRSASLLLFIVLMFSLLSPAAAEEPYNLDIYWVGNGDNPEIRAGVEGAVNEYIEPLINATVTFHIVNWDNWKAEAVTPLQEGKKMDLIFTADWEYYSSEIEEGLLLPLDDLLDQYGWGITATLPRKFLQGVRVNGSVYGIPTNKELCVPLGFIVNKTAAAEIDWDVTADDPSIKTTADLEPWLKKYKELHPDKYPYLMEGGQILRWADEPWIPDWIALYMNSVSMKMGPREDGTFDETIYSIFDTPEQEEHLRLMHRWMNDGYIDPRICDEGYDYNAEFGKGDFLVFTQPLKGNGIKAIEMMEANAKAVFECEEIVMQPKCIVTTHAGGSMFGIPVTSENPAAAMRYLNLMHYDATLINLMLYGEEGVNYVKTSPMKIDLLPDANWYGVHGGAWTVGNTKLQFVLSSENLYKNNLLQVYADDAVGTPSLGFRFVSAPVIEQCNAVNAVLEELGRPLMAGITDPDDPDRGLNALRSKLHDAGMPEILEEVRAQYENWKKDQ